MSKTVDLGRICRDCLSPYLGSLKDQCRYCYRKQYRQDNYARVKSQEEVLNNKNRDALRATSKRYKYSPEGRYSIGKRDAAARGLSFELTFVEYFGFLDKCCHYCTKPPAPTCGIGLDRKNNDRGYSTDNVLPSCGGCNVIRSDKLTVEEMEVAMAAVVKYRQGVETNVES